MIVEPQHFEYLVVQRGGISDLRDDFPAWLEAYERTLEADFQTIKSVLPHEARTLLDVGGGLSGIGAKINQHYGGGLCVCVLDSKAKPPVVTRHAKPYNNATITQNFLLKNGVRDSRFYAPEDEFDLTFDIVVSTQAWGFHFAPEPYLSRLEHHIHSGTTVVLDIRRSRTDWLEEFDDVFAEGHKVLQEREKWLRTAFGVAARA